MPLVDNPIVQLRASIPGFEELRSYQREIADAIANSFGVERVMLAERARVAPIMPKVIETLDATTPAEDWSRVRSPGRARRRMKLGHRQNIRHYRAPAAYMLDGNFYVHPEVMKELRRSTEMRMDREIEASILGMGRF